MQQRQGRARGGGERVNPHIVEQREAGFLLYSPATGSVIPVFYRQPVAFNPACIGDSRGRGLRPSQWWCPTVAVLKRAFTAGQRSTVTRECLTANQHRRRHTQDLQFGSISNA